jgi:hypothetical protein
MNNRPTNVARSGPLSVWGAGRLLARALTEQKICMAAVYDTAARIVRPPAGAPPEYAVRLGEIPDSFYDARKNLFSTLFYSAYLALNIPLPRRLLYGKLNHLFRIWVTAADNLLDSEDKCVLPLDMPGTSRVMREVVALMAADRVLGHLLDDAVSEGVLTRQQARDVADASLRNLLPSAAQEASEEGGVTVRPAPEYVLETVHLLKTGLLFNIPFTGVDIVERDVDHDRLDRIKRALLLFGNGCQVLDDVRDVARDFVEGRHNYVLSVLAHTRPEVLDDWSGRTITAGDRLYFEVPVESLAAARLGYQRLTAACQALREERVLAKGAPIAKMAGSLFTALDLEDLAYACA